MISNNQGIAGIAFSVELPEGYSLVSMKKGEVTSEGTFTVSENNCTWYTTDNIKTDGILLTLEVKAGENAKTGKIKVNVKDGKANNISDENGMTVPAVFTEGTVTILGDSCAVNGHKKDGKATCIKKAVCTVCGKEYGEVVSNKPRRGNRTPKCQESNMYRRWEIRRYLLQVLWNKDKRWKR